MGAVLSLVPNGRPDPFVDDDEPISAVVQVGARIVTMDELLDAPPQRERASTQQRAAQLGVQLLDVICDYPMEKTYRGKKRDGVDVSVRVLATDAPPPAQVAFSANIQGLQELTRRGGTPGVTPVYDCTDSCLVSAPVLGDASDLPVLGWSAARIVGFVESLSATLKQVHETQGPVGVWTIEDVLLDEDFGPSLGRVKPRSLGSASPNGTPLDAFVAPELASRAPMSAMDNFIAAADVYALGRLLTYLLLGETPRYEEAVPRLESLSKKPAGLVRIIRKCTMGSPAARYQSVDEVLSDLARYGMYTEVGLAHRGCVEGNQTGASLPPMSAPMSAPRSANDAPRSKRNVTLSIVPASALEQQPGSESAPTTKLPFVGGSLIGLSLVSAGLAGMDSPLHTALIASGSVGAALLGARARMARAPVVGRIALGAALALGLWLVDPVSEAAQLGDEMRLRASDPEVRAAQLLASAERGYREFDGIDLAGANLSGVDLGGAELDASSLLGADLTEANLSGATLDGVELSGANLRGASLEMTNLDSASGVEDAECDGETSLPDGWACIDGHPRESEDTGDEEADDDMLQEGIDW